MGCADYLKTWLLQNLTGYIANVAKCSPAITEKKLSWRQIFYPVVGTYSIPFSFIAGNLPCGKKKQNNRFQQTFELSVAVAPCNSKKKLTNVQNMFFHNGGNASAFVVSLIFVFICTTLVFLQTEIFLSFNPAENLKNHYDMLY